MKFHIIPNACSLEIIQSCVLKNLNKPSLLVTPPAHPSFLTILCRISTTINLSLQSMRESPLLSYLCSLLTTVQTSKMLLQVPELVCEEGFTRCQELWQNQCHSGISTEKKRCTTQAVCKHDYGRLHDSHLDLQDRMRHPIAILAEMMGDVMYLHQALRQPDFKEFVEAVINEVNGHVNNNHWKLIPRTEVPEGTEVVPSVWTMQHKRDLTTGNVTKHKARLNLHGGKQEFGTNYYETYAPVVTWFAI
jgi:hypothetical protein